MVESVDHAPGSLAEAPAVAGRTASRWAVPLPGAEQKRIELILVGLLAIIYGWAAGTLEPALAAPPSALLTHVLLLLGAAVAFLGLWDTLALLALRHLLQRDQRELWRQYSHPRDLRRRLDNSTFELDSELGAGLLAASLRRFAALGRPQGDFIARHLAVAIRSSRIGTASLVYAAVAAPILGVLGAAAGLRASLPSSAPGRVGPYPEAVAATFILGLSISLLALLFSRLLGASLAQDCASLLAPVVEASQGLTGRGKARRAEVSNHEAAFEKRALAWTKPPWSRELRRLRLAGALVSWLLTATLIVLLCLPGSLAAQWLGM